MWFMTLDWSLIDQVSINVFTVKFLHLCCIFENLKINDGKNQTNNYCVLLSGKSEE